MAQYKIHPIVMGTKVFDKSMMTYQHGSGEEFTIAIYCWYLEGGDQKILVDTGSGSVKAKSLICSALDIDTGSGSVRALHVETDDAKIDTGSGSVLLQLDRMGSGRFVLDTGSGGIVLELPADASARISADTGSGSMNNELHGALVKNKGRREMTLVVGDGEANVILDAGSGSITVK